MAEPALKLAPQPDTAAVPGKRPAPERRRRLVRMLLLVVLPAIVLLVGVGFYLSGGRYVATDNAYIGAQKVLITPDISRSPTKSPHSATPSQYCCSACRSPSRRCPRCRPSCRSCWPSVCSTWPGAMQSSRNCIRWRRSARPPSSLGQDRHADEERDDDPTHPHLVPARSRNSPAWATGPRAARWLPVGNCPTWRLPGRPAWCSPAGRWPTTRN